MRATYVGPCVSFGAGQKVQGRWGCWGHWGCRGRWGRWGRWGHWRRPASALLEEQQQVHEAILRTKIDAMLNYEDEAVISRLRWSRPRGTKLEQQQVGVPLLSRAFPRAIAA